MASDAAATVAADNDYIKIDNNGDYSNDDNDSMVIMKMMIT